MCYRLPSTVVTYKYLYMGAQQKTSVHKISIKSGVTMSYAVYEHFDSPVGHKTLFRKLLQNNNNKLTTYKNVIKLSIMYYFVCEHTSVSKR